MFTLSKALAAHDREHAGVYPASRSPSSMRKPSGPRPLLVEGNKHDARDRVVFGGIHRSRLTL